MSQISLSYIKTLSLLLLLYKTEKMRLNDWEDMLSGWLTWTCQIATIPDMPITIIYNFHNMIYPQKQNQSV